MLFLTKLIENLHSPKSFGGREARVMHISAILCAIYLQIAANAFKFA